MDFNLINYYEYEILEFKLVKNNKIISSSKDVIYND